LHPRIVALEDHLKRWPRVIVAYSGGVDSTFLAAVAHRALGEAALAVTLITESDARDEMDFAVETARGLGLRHRVERAPWLAIPGVAGNPLDRCYRCKRHLFGLLQDLASSEGAVVLEGSNADDVSDYRPGMRAVEELSVESPLLDLGFRKPEIRELSRLLGLPSADRPSMACLASRFPYGATITEQALLQVDRAECALRDLGLAVVRVRHHGETARVEVAPDELQAAFERRESVASRLRALGYAHVALDLDGYRTGSMNVRVRES
jgi:uncharacterized protein